MKDLKGKLETMSEEEKENRKTNRIIVPLKAIRGGNDGNIPWILNQVRGTEFLARNEDNTPDAKKDPLLRRFILVDKDEQNVQIVNTKLKLDEWVDAERFCKLYSLSKILCVYDLSKINVLELEEEEDE